MSRLPAACPAFEVMTDGLAWLGIERGEVVTGAPPARPSPHCALLDIVRPNGAELASVPAVAMLPLNQAAQTVLDEAKP